MRISSGWSETKIFTNSTAIRSLLTFASVGANTVGIMYNPFKGGVQDEVLGEGFRWKSPFDKVYKISTEVQEFQFEQISVQTNDSQYINTILQLQVRIDKEHLVGKKYELIEADLLTTEEGKITHNSMKISSIIFSYLMR